VFSGTAVAFKTQSGTIGSRGDRDCFVARATSAPAVVAATLRVLARNGCATTIMDNTCCGRPAHSYGDLDTARDIARKNLDRMAEEAVDLEAIVSDCGSCSTHLKEYGALLKDDPAYRDKAAALSAKIRSFSEYLAGIGLGEAPGDLPGTVTYHDPCHLSNRFAKITAQPRKLLKAVPGLAFKELPEADWCCGAAGSYTFLHHEEASGVLDRKMKNVEKTGAATLVTTGSTVVWAASTAAATFVSPAGTLVWPLPLSPQQCTPMLSNAQV